MPQVKRPKTRRELTERLEAVRLAMRQHATVLPPEQAEARRQRSAADPFFFYRTYLPHYFQDASPKFHRQLLHEANEPGINALAAPRGFSKSTLITLAETLRRVVLELTHFQIIVKENEELAGDEVAAIRLELEDNPRIRADYGDLVRRGSWEENDFITTTGFRVLGLGKGQKIRGLKHRQHRPGRVVLDDVENDKNVRNPRLVRELIDWVFRAVYPSLDPNNGVLTWVGTLLSKRSALSQVMGRDGINSHKWAAEDKTGRPLWDARFPRAKLAEIKKKVGSLAWRTEFLNEPSDDPDAPFQEKYLRRYSPNTIEQVDVRMVVIACDPSLRSGAKSDFKAIVPLLVLNEYEGRKGPFYAVVAPWVRQDSLTKMFNQLFLLDDRLTPVRIGLETQSWQELLLNDVRRMEEERDHRLPITGITNSSNKEGRILRLSALWENGYILLPDDDDDPDVRELLDQILGFGDAAIPDDGPDALEMAIRIAERAGRKIDKVRRL